MRKIVILVVIKEICDDSHERNAIFELDDMINNSTNKYYYPTENDINIFINCKTSIERKQTRIVYMIKQICGHTIIEHDTTELIKQINLTSSNIIFSVNYDSVPNEII